MIILINIIITFPILDSLNFMIDECATLTNICFREFILGKREQEKTSATKVSLNISIKMSSRTSKEKLKLN